MQCYNAQGMKCFFVTFQYVVLNTRINNRWLPRIPNNFRFSSAVEKITNVVEVKDTGFDIYVNGRHQFYPHRIDVTRTNWIHTFGGNIVQFSMGKVSTHEGIIMLRCLIR